MKVKFVPTNAEIEIEPGKSLLQACIENHIDINSICKGIPKCAECRIKIVDGEYNLAPPSTAELSLIGSSYYIDQRRLSCQVYAFGPITVDLTEQIERSEVQNKKVRGFKVHGQKTETKAVQGTMMLDANTESPASVESAGSKSFSQTGDDEGQQSGKGASQNQGQNQGQSQNQSRGGNQNQRQGNSPQQRNQQRNQNNQRGPQQSKNDRPKGNRR